MFLFSSKMVKYLNETSRYGSAFFQGHKFADWWRLDSNPGPRCYRWQTYCHRSKGNLDSSMSWYFASIALCTLQYYPLRLEGCTPAASATRPHRSPRLPHMQVHPITCPPCIHRAMGSLMAATCEVGEGWRLNSNPGPLACSLLHETDILPSQLKEILAVLCLRIWPVKHRLPCNKGDPPSLAMIRWIFPI